MKLCLAVLAATVLTAPLPAQATESGTQKLASDKGVTSSTPKKITDRRHPDYVRCRSEPIIGALARKRRVCMTNAEWAAAIKASSRNAKEFVDDQQPGFMIN